MANITILESYYTGSHRRWIDEFCSNTSHTPRTYTLPGRFWKWRMHGGAVTLARRVLESFKETDLFLATDMLDLTTFLSLTRKITYNTPVAIYFHENQLTYPPPPTEKRNLHYGYINYLSMLASDKVLFNSDFHKTAWFEELPRLLKHFPDYNELETIDELKVKSEVLPLGLDLEKFNVHKTTTKKAERPLRIIWNHRWEYDKNPEAFFNALYALQSDNYAFEVIVLGKSFRQRPEEFLEAQEQLKDHIVHFGYADDFETYASLLWAADIQISTAIQDFFGSSTCEAIYCDCFPLLPNRLNYPSFIPDEHHKLCLYNSQEDLITKLKWACENVDIVRDFSLRETAANYDWKSLIPKYDYIFENMISE